MKKNVIAIIMFTLSVLILTACSSSEKNIETQKSNIAVTDSQENKLSEETDNIEKIKQKYNGVDEINEIYCSDERQSRDGLVSVKKVCFDIDDDGEEEIIELFIKAEVDESGNLILNDGNNWYLLFNDGENEYVLIDEYVQLGTLDFWLIEDMNTHEKTIKVLNAGSACFNIRDFDMNIDKLNGVILSFYSYNEEGNISVR